MRREGGVVTSRLFYGAGLLFFSLFLIYPLLFILMQAFYSKGEISLLYFGFILKNQSYREAILNTLGVGACATIFSLLIGGSLAVVMVRTQFFGKKVFGILLLLPLFVPPFVGSLGVKQLLGRFGSINLLLMSARFVTTPVDFLGEYKAIGIAGIQALHLFPLVYLTLASTLASISPHLEEAGYVVGAKRSAIWMKIIIPLLKPTALSAATLVFLGSLADLGTPLLFDYRESLPVQIFNLVSDTTENPTGYALVVTIALLAILLGLLARGDSARGERVHERAPRGALRGDQQRLTGGWSIIAPVFVGSILTVAALPHIGVFLLSISKKWFLTILPQEYTFHFYEEVFRHPLTVGSMKMSFFLAISAGALDLLLGVTCAWLRERTRLKGVALLEGVIMVPLLIPGVVLAFGYLGAFRGTFLDCRINPILLLIVAYGIRRLPYLFRSAVAGLREGSVALEEAGATVGASRALVFRKITLPLMKNHLIAGTILCVIFALLEVSDSLILAMEDKFFPISKALYAMSQRPDGYGLACALAVLVTLFSLCALLLAAKSSGRDLGQFFRGS